MLNDLKWDCVLAHFVDMHAIKFDWLKIAFYLIFYLNFTHTHTHKLSNCRMPLETHWKQTISGQSGKLHSIRWTWRGDEAHHSGYCVCSRLDTHRILIECHWICALIHAHHTKAKWSRFSSLLIRLFNLAGDYVELTTMTTSIQKVDARKKPTTFDLWINENKELAIMRRWKLTIRIFLELISK